MASTKERKVKGNVFIFCLLNYFASIFHALIKNIRHVINYIRKCIDLEYLLYFVIFLEAVLF